MSDPMSAPITIQLQQELRRRIVLPTSKSLSNRALLLSALSGGGSDVVRPSDCDDTRVMQRALRERTECIDIQAAGTAMRFLTAYLANCPGEHHVITGTERMRQRPIGVLVEALRQLGADIAYEEREGCPPLRIGGRRLLGGRLAMRGDVSSQYVSALLMVAPTMAEGLVLELEGEVGSRPYIDMTLALMQHFGAQAEWTTDRTIRVLPGGYRRGVRFEVESDWSAASYWYELVALTTDREARVVLPWLHRESLQGDAAVRTFFAPLGVHTEFTAEADGTPVAVLTKRREEQLPEGEVLELDLLCQPDLAQTLVVTCAMLRRPFRFTGLQSLRIKETDRVAALQAELLKFGIELEATPDGSELHIFRYAAGVPAYDGRPLLTYADHRMAMAFAPAALVAGPLHMEHPEVVSKSYPAFWGDVL